MRLKVNKISRHDHIKFNFQTNEKTNSEKMSNSMHNVSWDISIGYKLLFELEPNESLLSYITYIICPI